MKRAPSLSGECELIFCFRGAKPPEANDPTKGLLTAPGHRHDVWQLEFFLEGKSLFELGDERIETAPGLAVLIPPNMPHRICRVETRAEYLYVMFRRALPVYDKPLIFHIDSRPRRLLLDTLLALVSGQNALTQAERLVAQNVINAFIQLYFHETGRDRGSHPLVEKARRYIDRNSTRRLPLTEIAEKVECSPSHLSALFRHQEGLSLKSYIDHQRAKTLERYLSYSEQSIGEIAETMGFNDVYSFSRFFKREMGACPRAFRKRMSDAAGKG